jgi:hypothetical protein
MKPALVSTSEKAPLCEQQAILGTSAIQIKVDCKANQEILQESGKQKAHNS